MFKEGEKGQTRHFCLVDGCDEVANSIYCEEHTLIFSNLALSSGTFKFKKQITELTQALAESEKARGILERALVEACIDRNGQCNSLYIVYKDDGGHCSKSKDYLCVVCWTEYFKQLAEEEGKDESV